MLNQTTKTNGSNFSQIQIDKLISHYSNSEFNATLTLAKQLIKKGPPLGIYYNIIGAVYFEKGQIKLALQNFKKFVELQPENPIALNNLGVALYGQKKSQEAKTVLEKAIKINPNYAEAYNNLGNVYKEAKDYMTAINCYSDAIEINSNFAKAHYNKGNALQDNGDMDGALESFNKALEINPNSAQSHYSMGIVYRDIGKKELSKKSFQKAVIIDPNHFDSLWNLHGTSQSIEEAQSWIKRCLKVNGDYIGSILMQAALNFYQGNEADYDALLKSNLKDHPVMRSFEWVFNLPTLPPLYFCRWSFFNSIISKSLKERPFYEYGVWRGNSFKYLIKSFKKGYGFDTFIGLPKDWHDTKAGSYSSKGIVPEIKGGKFIIGEFKDSLPKFFSQSRPLASLINFDSDLYSSTICALSYSKSVIDEHTILIFDELIMNKNWEKDEYRALNEFCCTNGYKYEVMAVSFFTKQVAVKLISH